MERIKKCLFAFTVILPVALTAACDNDGPMENAGEEIDDAYGDAQDRVD